MFKWLKFGAAVTLGLLMAPKKGSELRKDFVNSLKKYRPQLKRLIISLEEAWEKSQSVQSDEITAQIEMKIADVKDASEILDAAKTKELAYKAISKIGNSAAKLIKNAAKSPNVIAVAKDIAKITVNVIDTSTKIYDKVKETSESLTENTYQPTDEENIASNMTGTSETESDHYIEEVFEVEIKSDEQNDDIKNKDEEK
ncbi:YtxH domain-containing protein [Spiroplasma endosymbiont of Labia minor]|uniref:YtxH domain-containing protein n=1 Tax=Spiroplasma endosymbiont of Labia minor TaxID=3066305 RepID=UPI0030CD660C